MIENPLVQKSRDELGTDLLQRACSHRVTEQGSFGGYNPGGQTQDERQPAYYPHDLDG